MLYFKIDGACQSSPGNLINHSTGEIYAASCKKWDCRTCGPRAARRFVARVLRTPRFTYFVTLTAPPHPPELDAPLVRGFNRSWRTWRQWLKRNAGVGHCTWTLERGSKHGHLHRHAMIETSRRFSYSDARAALVRAGCGPVCDFKRIKSKGSVQAGARYIGKYLAKHLGDAHWPRYTRRAQCSIKDNRLPPGPAWHFVARPVAIWRRREESPTPLVNEWWRADEMIWSQSSLALNQYEKLHQEVSANDLESSVEAEDRGP